MMAIKLLILYVSCFIIFPNISVLKLTSGGIKRVGLFLLICTNHQFDF